MDNSGYFTHRPIVKSVLDSIKNPNLIVELGCGEGSTPMLHDYTKKGFTVWTYDHDESWISQFYAFQDERHWVQKIDSIDCWHEIYLTIKRDLKDDRGSLLFVDNAPWEARSDAIETLKHYFDYVILHDCDYFPRNGLLGMPDGTYCGNWSNVFKYWQTFDIDRPPTIVGSMHNICDFTIEN